jgi:hypothetical protein
MMGKIYNFASSVRIWLGEKGHHSREAILLLHEIWDSFEEVSASSTQAQEKARALNQKMYERSTEPASPSSIFHSLKELPPWPESINTEEISQNSIYMLVQERKLAWWKRLAWGSEPIGPWEGVACLLERTYWSRIWIVQEYLSLPTATIQCGWDYINRQRFDKAVSKIGGLVKLRKEHYPQLPSSIQNSLERINNSPGIKICE